MNESQFTLEGGVGGPIFSPVVAFSIEIKTSSKVLLTRILLFEIFG